MTIASSSVVYFIRPSGSAGPVKIGMTENLKLRVYGLRSASPVPLEVWCSIPGDRALERRIHLAFARDRLHSEWFSFSEKLGDLVSQIKAGKFDPSDLPPDNRWYSQPIKAVANVEVWRLA